jgi:hypothetical protein
MLPTDLTSNITNANHTNRIVVTMCIITKLEDARCNECGNPVYYDVYICDQAKTNGRQCTTEVTSSVNRWLTKTCPECSSNIELAERMFHNPMG